MTITIYNIIWLYILFVWGIVGIAWFIEGIIVRYFKTTIDNSTALDLFIAGPIVWCLVAWVGVIEFIKYIKGDIDHD